MKDSLPTPEWLETARTLFRAGDFLGTCDLASALVETGVVEPELIHLAVLSLARCGATTEALRLMERFSAVLPGDEEFGALAARLRKDLFRSSRTEAEAEKWCREARDRYRSVFEHTGGYFSGINAATLSILLSKYDPAEKQRGCELARQVLKLCAGPAGLDFWGTVTRAEAQLLLGATSEVEALLKEARGLRPDDVASQGTTYKQLELICKNEGVSLEVVSAIRPAGVTHYTGHLVHGLGTNPGVNPADEPRLRAQISDILAREQIGESFGALACGADILVAEEIVRRGGKLNVVLPFGEQEFYQTSVVRAGGDWGERYHRLLGSAASVSRVVEEGQCDLELLYQLASLKAMGSAVLRAEHLGSSVHQIALWNGIPAGNAVCGTAPDMAVWAQLGYQQHVIRLESASAVAPAPVPGGAASASVECDAALRRTVVGLIFADLHGFSRLTERKLVDLTAEWLRKLGELKRRYDDQIVYLNTWGDAVFMVVKDVASAAELSLELAETMSGAAWQAVGLGEVEGLRVSAHAGAVLSVNDPIRGGKAFFGVDVTKTARMEPCTPVGHVYVTEEFAALLAVSKKTAGGRTYRCEYVGVQKLPKDFGSFRMYHLGGG